MQNNSVLLILSILSILQHVSTSDNAAARSRCWTSGNGRAAQWWPEGEQVTRGKFFYECRRGQLEPLGCLSSTEQKIAIGATFQQDGYEFVCQLGSDGYIEFGYNACVASDGRTYQKGETWTDAKVRRCCNIYYVTSGDRGNTAGGDYSRRVNLGLGLSKNLTRGWSELTMEFTSSVFPSEFNCLSVMLDLVHKLQSQF
ncbi:hypothetical protein CRE_22728 [Caenorhabditis remanei]|uniref:Abnormal cell migration protein 18-like fibronectin type I domain-containing protein n=1 Tax=Caenorhabditis remanei TaxID=31234 RepID=E3NMM5_CAERE|nr:hypothetical protein CRE_22728 [Caenorhabditis remanei]